MIKYLLQRTVNCLKISQEKEDVIITDFNEAEALQLAQKIEDDGIKFYLKAAEIVKDTKVKEAFKMLAKEEEKHVNLFKEMLEKLIKEKKLDLEANSGAEEHFFDFIDPQIFGDIFDLEKIVGKIESDIKAVELGEDAEVNSINFYKALLKNTENEGGKKIIKDIIKEEQEHLKTFLRYRDMLAKCK